LFSGKLKELDEIEFVKVEEEWKKIKEEEWFKKEVQQVKFDNAQAI
jgi:hypothetical protein